MTLELKTKNINSLKTQIIMKKFLSKIMFAAVAVLSAAGFTSCNNSDDDPYVPTPDATLYGKAVVKVSESVFEYATATLVLEYDGQTKSFPLNESTKVAKDKDMSDVFGADKAAARVLDVPVFSYKNAPVKATIKYELTEAGKKKLADEPEGSVNHDELTFFGKAKSDGSALVKLQAGGLGGIKHARYADYLKRASALAYYIK